MPTHELDARLAAADPLRDADLSADLARLRRQALADPGPAPARPRRRVLAASVAAATAAIAVAMAVLPGGREETTSPLGELPGPVQAFADELLADGMGSDGLLHMVADEIDVTTITYPRHGPKTSTQRVRRESWDALDGSRSRDVAAIPGHGTMETTFDGRRAETVHPERGLISIGRVNPVERYWLHRGWIVELRRALATGRLRVSGETRVRGRPAYHAVVPGDSLPTDEDPQNPDIHVYVARDDHALLRTEQVRKEQLRESTGEASGMTLRRIDRLEVLTYEVLPATAENRRLLERSPSLREIAKVDTPAERAVVRGQCRGCPSPPGG